MLYLLLASLSIYFSLTLYHLTLFISHLFFILALLCSLSLALFLTRFLSSTRTVFHSFARTISHSSSSTRTVFHSFARHYVFLTRFLLLALFLTRSLALFLTRSLALFLARCLPLLYSLLLRRDVKTANILLDAQLQARIGDFGNPDTSALSRFNL